MILMATDSFRRRARVTGEEHPNKELTVYTIFNDCMSPVIQTRIRKVEYFFSLLNIQGHITIMY